MGAFEEAKGKVKQAIGDLTDSAKLQEEGAAQEAKGEHEQAETKARAEAREHDEKARRFEEEEARRQQ
jgi:uncharacterized protein YjbJ (UPF0337 family)